MVKCKPDRRIFVGNLLKLANAETKHHVVSKTYRGKSSTREKWCSFCREQGWTPLLKEFDEAECFMALQAFGQAYRLGAGNRGNVPVTARTVSTALGHIGQMFTKLGEPDPRHIPGTTVFHRAYSEWRTGLQRRDPSAHRTYPCSLEIIRELFAMDLSELECVARDLIVIGFFYLNRPGEVVRTASNDRGLSSPFRLCDVHLSFGPTSWRASTTLPPRLASCNDVLTSDTASLEYTDQKNSVRGEKIRHAASGDPDICPVRAVERRIQHLRRFHAPAETPLYTYYADSGVPRDCHTQLVTKLLKQAAERAFPRTGIPKGKISARSLRPGGATAMLCAGFAPIDIQLVGRWNSEAMLRYLRADASPAVHQYAVKMLASGSFSYQPKSLASATASLIPQEAPEAASALADLADDVEDLADEADYPAGEIPAEVRAAAN